MLNQLNAWAGQVSSTDILIMSSLVTPAILGLVNRYKPLHKLVNVALGLVGMPALVTAAATFTTANHLHFATWPIVAILGQVVYYVAKAAKEQLQLQPETVPAPEAQF